MHRVAFLFVLTLLLALLSGCGRPPEVEVKAWALDVAVTSMEGSEAHVRPASARVVLPTRIDDLLPSQPVDYTLRTRAVLPPEFRGRDLTFAIVSLQAMASLRVDGIEATSLDVRPFDRYHASGPLRFRVPAAATTDGELDLELTVRHRWRESAWLTAVPFLTTDLDGGSRLVFVSVLNEIAAGAALAATSFVVLLYGYLFVFLRGARSRIYGLFALSSGMVAAYPAFLLGATQIFGVYEAEIVGAMLVVGPVTAMYFARAYFALPPPHQAWKGWVSFAVVAILVVRDPFRSVFLLAPLIGVSAVANTVAQAVLLARLRRRDPPPRNLYSIVLAWPATAVLGIPDFIALLGLGETFGGARTACIGIAVIAVMQTMAILREHVSSLARSDRLNRELGDRVALLEQKQREVEVLNDDLRRQIAARTRHLAASFALEEDPVVHPGVLLEPGAVIEDRYRVLRSIGQGGMGAVYEVVRVMDGKHFALKTLSGASDPMTRARFAREAELAANVKHPNVVAVVDFDVARLGYLFLVMEFVSGDTLHQVRRRQHDVPWTLYVLAQLAAGLDAIHAQGIVHRDLKPTNVLLSRGTDGRRPLVKITDFGVSSAHDEGLEEWSVVPSAGEVAERAPTSNDASEPPVVPATTRESGEAGLAQFPLLGEPTRPDPHGNPADLTKTGVIFGTPYYMAAELAGGAKLATRAADVYSLGVIAYELLTFQRPFRDCPVHAIRRGRLPETPPSFAHACPSLPPELAALLTRALQHDPELRPAAHELAVALRASLASVGEAASAER